MNINSPPRTCHFPCWKQLQKDDTFQIILKYICNFSKLYTLFSLNLCRQLSFMEHSCNILLLMKTSTFNQITYIHSALLYTITCLFSYLGAKLLNIHEYWFQHIPDLQSAFCLLEQMAWIYTCSQEEASSFTNRSPPPQSYAN